MFLPNRRHGNEGPPETVKDSTTKMTAKLLGIFLFFLCMNLEDKIEQYQLTCETENVYPTRKEFFYWESRTLPWFIKPQSQTHLLGRWSLSPLQCWKKTGKSMTPSLLTR